METAPRITARLDDESREHLRYLVDATGKATSELVRESLALYSRHVKALRRGPVHLLALAGKGDSGHTDTASNVKKVVGEALDKKYPQHSRR